MPVELEHYEVVDPSGPISKADGLLSALVAAVGVRGRPVMTRRAA